MRAKNVSRKKTFLVFLTINSLTYMSLIKGFFLFACIVLSNCAYSFSVETDLARSLRLELSKETDPEQKVIVLKKIIQGYERYEADSLLFYTEKLLAIAKPLKDKVALGYVQHQYAQVYFLKNDWKSAKSKLEESILIHEELGKQEFVNADLLKLGAVLTQLGRLYEASTKFQILVDIFNQNGNVLGEASAYSNLSNVLLLADMNEEALEASLRSLALKKKLSDEVTVARSNYSVGMVYSLLDENEKSLEFMQKGIFLCEERNSHGNLCLMYRGLAELLTKMGKFDEALIELDKATNSCLKLDDEYQELVTVVNIIDVLVTNSQFNEALEKSKRGIEILEGTSGPEMELMLFVQRGESFIALKQYQNAIVALKKAEKIEKLDSQDEFHPEIFELLAKAYQEIGDIDNALSAQVEFKLYSDSLTMATAKTDIAKENLHYTFKRERAKDKLIQIRKDKLVQEKLNQITAKKENAEFRKNTTIILSVVLLLAGGFLFWYRAKKYKKREIEDEKEIRTVKQGLSDSEQEVSSLNDTLQDKNRQLTSVTLNSTHSDQVLEELKNQLRELIRRHDGSVNSDLNKMHNVIRSSEIEKEVIANFILQFEGVHPGYLESLLEISPQLSTSDLRICAMMKLNLNSHEISTIQGISISSLRTVRHRIHKKIGIEKGVKLQDFLLKVE